MWKENLYRPIEILLREHDDFPVGKHQHSFFEMVYILAGSGNFEADVLHSEQEHCSYHANDLFLIPPDSPHLFTIANHSRFVFIRFTRNYLVDYINCQFENCLEIQAAFRLDLSESDSDSVSQLMHLIVGEMNRKCNLNLSELLLQHYVNSIILLCTRNLSAITSEYDNLSNNKPQYMLQYIQQHIHQPELLTLNILADRFHLSPKYVGRFFKRNFGEDYKQYLSRNRLKRVEDMLINTRMTIKEIAAQMGYADSCYLNKLFIQHHGMTPLQFRKRNSHLSGILKSNQ